MNALPILDGTIALLTVLARLGEAARLLREEFDRPRAAGEDVSEEAITRALDDLETHLVHFRGLR